MSGHSKWAKTHRQKEASDQKRGAVFTRLAKAVSLAAHEGGGDPGANFKLRMAMDKAKQSNMPKDNIERAIKRGTGELKGQIIEEIIYEAIGPENVAILIQVLTDNKNRTLTNVKNILAKNNGKFVNSGSVSWMFEQKGVITISDIKNFTSPNSGQVPNIENLQLELIESGANDFKEQEDELTIYTDINKLQKIKEILEQKNIKINSAEIEHVPRNENLVKPSDNTKIEQLLNTLAEDDDVEKIYTNMK